MILVSIAFAATWKPWAQISAGSPAFRTRRLIILSAFTRDIARFRRTLRRPDWQLRKRGPRRETERIGSSACSSTRWPGTRRTHVPNDGIIAMSAPCATAGLHHDATKGAVAYANHSIFVGNRRTLRVGSEVSLRPRNLPRTWLLSGIPRSGTSFCCRLGEAHLAPEDIIRYEDLIASGGLALFRQPCRADARHVAPESRNDSALYDRSMVERLLDALLNTGGAWTHFYRPADCEEVAAWIRHDT